MKNDKIKKTYTPPTLVEYGPLQKLTLDEEGGTPFGEEDGEGGESEQEVGGEESGEEEG